MSSAWWVDRVLPGVVTSAIWAVALWVSHRRLWRRLRSHIDQITIDQNVRIEQITRGQNARIEEITAAQTRRIEEITAAQTAAIAASRQPDGGNDAV